MRTPGPAPRSLAALLLAGCLLAFPEGALAQAGTPPPLRARLFFQTAPPDATFAPTDPIPLVLQLDNLSGGSLTTTAGFSDAPHYRRLFFERPFAGGFVTNTTEVHVETTTSFCFVRGGVLQTPTALRVRRAEVLAARFFREYRFDARAFYDLPPGRYQVVAQIPFDTYSVSANAVITNCNDFPGQTLLNLAASIDQGRQAFTIVSNRLDFTVSSARFVGFGTPLVNDSVCGATLTTPVTPCRTFRFRSTVPVKFQLFDANNVAIGTTVATIRVTQVGGATVGDTIDLGTGATDTGNTFRFDPVSNQYIFNLDTKVLGAGVWRIDARLDDGAVHSVHIGLR
ncbi:MAG: PxKF domain-containing protein [Candidatus Rokubacteria bacterium]|nr:PxKF domain-containing protein [Candidatus Rokubacteria bacterium]